MTIPVELLFTIAMFCQAPKPYLQTECNKVMIRCVEAQILKDLDGYTFLEDIRATALTKCILHDGEVQK